MFYAVLTDSLTMGAPKAHETIAFRSTFICSLIQSPLAIVNDKNRALSVHYSQVFTIPKLTKVVLE